MNPEADLRLASLQDCAVMEVRKDGTISHLSPSWEHFTHQKAADFINKPVSEIVDGGDPDKQVFEAAVAQMHNQSFRIVFSVGGVPVEAQGILVEDSYPVYSLWILRPFQGELGGTLGAALKEAVGTGAEELEMFLGELKAAVFENRLSYPVPRYILCHICDSYIPNYWFARHTEFCTIGHTLESRIVQSHDRLVEHKAVLQQLLQSKHAEYKGTLLRGRSQLQLHAVRVSSPLASPLRRNSADEFTATLQALSEVVDEALEVDIPEDESGSEGELEVRSQDLDLAQRLDEVPPLDGDILGEFDDLPPPNVPSVSIPIPTSTRRTLLGQVAHLQTWTPPTVKDAGLQTLCADTATLVQQKLGYVMRMNNFFALSRKAHTEVEQLVAEQVAQITGEVDAAAVGAVGGIDLSVDVAMEDTEDDETPRVTDHTIAAGLAPDPAPVAPPGAPPGALGGGPGRASPQTPQGLGLQIDPQNLSPVSQSAASATAATSQPKLSPTSSPWQSPMPSPRLGPIHHRSASRSALPMRDRSTSVASDDSGSTSSRFKTRAPSISDYEIVSPISRGAFATVYLTRKKIGGEYFAMKCLKKSEVHEKNQVLNVKSERAILMSTAESPYVAKLYYTFQTRDYLYFVMEYVNGGDCASLLRALVCLTEDWARRYIAETVVAVQSLHAQGIVHCDLKPENLLIDSKGHLKLSDFGLSTKSLKKKRHENKSQQFFGTPDYCAPETIKLEKQSSATDWWALGCVLYEFLYGAPPFNDESPQAIFERVLARDIQWPVLTPDLDASEAAKDLILRLLELDPAARPEVEAIKQHKFFEGLEWSTLFEQEPSFIPEINRPDQTDYFDHRGASMSSFEDLPTVSVEDAGVVASGASVASMASVSSAGSAGTSLGGSTSAGAPLANASGTPQSPYSGLKRAPSTASMSSTVSSRRASRLDSDGEFGPFSYKNVSMLERQNLELLTKLKTEADLRPRRLSMSSPISGAGAGNAYWESAVHDSSPFASDTEESASKHAALSRVHRRRLQRKSSSSAIDSPPIHFVPDVLICISNPIWLYSTEKLLRDLGCRVVSCSSGDETIRRGSSSVKFDLILVDFHLSSGLQPQDIAHILQVTMNANSATPILLMVPAGETASAQFSGALEVPVDRIKLLEALRRYCNWAPG